MARLIVTKYGILRFIFFFFLLKQHLLTAFSVLLLSLVFTVSCSNSGKISLHPVRPGGSHAATYAGDLWRGAATPARVCSSRTGDTHYCFFLTGKTEVWFFFKHLSWFGDRLWMSWAKRESPRPSQVSRPTQRRYCWPTERGLSWQQRSIFLSHPSWRAL